MAERSEVKGFLQNVLGLCDPALVELLGERMTVVHAKKGDVLQKSGMPVREIGFLVSGVLRGYYTDAAGNEATDCFVIVPGSPAVSCLSLDKPSPIAFEALEKSMLYSIDIETVMELLKKSPEVLALENRLLRASLELHWEREMLLAQCSATERYQAFLKKFPGLIDRINHKMVASYLGITPVQLSRVRHSLKTDGNLHNPEENIASIIEPLFTAKL